MTKQMTLAEFEALPEDAFVSSIDMTSVILESIKGIKYPHYVNGVGMSETAYQLHLAMNRGK